MRAGASATRPPGLRWSVGRPWLRDAMVPTTALATRDKHALSAPGDVWRWLPARWWPLSVAGAFLAVTLCLVMARAAGFPLDDSWIHQDFARTLATTGRFAFQPGRGGAGSTSPLWVLLLLPPHLVAQGQAPTWLLVGWSALLGAVTLGSLGIVTGGIAADLALRTGAEERVVRLAAVLCAVATISEWHLVWAAASGMETDFFALLVMVLLWGAARRKPPFWLGLLAGVTTAVRPEGLLADAVVVCCACWAAVRQEKPGAGGVAETPRPAWPWRDGRGHAGWLDGLLALEPRRIPLWLRGWLMPFVNGMLIAGVPYALWNIGMSGHALPSTFYAKGAFYEIGPAALVLLGFLVQVLVVLVGSSPVLLVLAALSCSRRLLRGTTRRAATEGAGRQDGQDGAKRFPLGAALVLWPVLLVVAYGLHLPVLYHHGRYLMPALPAVLGLAAAGAAPLLMDRQRALLRTVGGLTLLASCLFSLGRGAQIYGSNVRYIDDFQVSTAYWLRAHTPGGSLIATHDVGAIGYFSNRPVLDMAGLVDPQVVPFVSDQDALQRYLTRRHAAYVVMFVDWYPPPATLAHHLAGGAVYRASAREFASQPGSEFVVFRTGW